MKTITLTEKDFKDGIYCGKEDLSNIEGNLEIEKGGWCRFEGGISAEGDISAEGGIYAEGDISAKGGIYAKGGILKSGYGITAGLKIFAKTTISATMRIFAGTASWSWVGDEEKKIECGKLESGTIAYGTLIENGLPDEQKIGKKVKIKVADGQIIEGEII